jgi:hypothetical protein
MAIQPTDRCATRLRSTYSLLIRGQFDDLTALRKDRHKNVREHHASAASMIEYNVQQCHCVHLLAARARLT